MKFLKYEFTPTQWATAKAKIQTTNEEGEPTWDATKVVAVVELGHLCTEWGTDEDGNQESPSRGFSFCSNFVPVETHLV
jgi:hypothetical protein